MFIEKLNFTADTDLMLDDLNMVLSTEPWPEKKIESTDRIYHANQLGLTYRVGAEYPWYDASGSLYDKSKGHFTDKEINFTEWNPVGEYTKNIIKSLKDSLGIEFGRMRYMRLMPKTGLSVHKDFDARYHYVLKTTPHAYFGLAETDNDVSAKCYHIPADGHFYRVDTTRDHFVFNGSWEPRIHLVLSEIK
jgi:hypothetical protein